MTLRSRPRCRAIVLIVVAGLSLSACGMFGCSGAATNGGGGRRLRSRHAILNAGWAAVSPAANTLVRPAGGR